MSEGFGRADVEQSIASRFEAQVARFPRRVAVSADGCAVTYEQLDTHANRIAHALLERSSGPRVALLMEHGALVPAAVFGGLKAGRGLVPLSAGNPVERNATVLADARVGAILTDRASAAAARALAARLPEATIAVVEVEDVASYPSRHPGTVASPADTGFIVYTSGSTGAPKGVVQPHRMSLFGCYCYANLAALDPHDRLSWVQSIGTMAGVTALFGALLNGAAICPFPVQRRGLDELATWIDAERITVLHTVPTLFRRLAQRLPADRRFEQLRVVRFGGEAVTATEVALLRAHCPPSSQLLVGLGSSEAGNFRQSLYAWDDIPTDAVLPAGDAVAEREASLVDDAGRPASPGEIGEIVVTSEFLFDGYWQRPDLTAAVLSADPDDPRRRRFRTGDLARVAPDGRFFHVGRADHQVKIAGNRVETAEIEHALRTIAPIRDAAVLPAPGADAGTVLVAFVTTGDAAVSAPTARELRTRLRAALPDYMIPRRIEVLDDLPVLPGGKVDRAALRANATGARVAWVPPRNPVEETVAAIWERALQLRDLGVDDDFLLDLGGDSLAAVQILADVQAVFGRELPLETFVASPTVARLSARLQDAGWEPAADVLLLNEQGTRPPLFALCGAYGHALRLLLIAQRLGPDQPFHALQPPGMNWTRAGCRTVEAMAAHYRAEIQRRQPRGPYRLLGTSIGGALMFEVAVQLQRAGHTVALLAMVDTMPPDCAVDSGIDRAARRDWAGNVDPSVDRWVAAGARVAEAHRRAFDDYVLHARFDGRILYFHCRDASVPAEGDRRALWRRFATGGVDVVTVPGIHGDFHRDPQCVAVAEALDAALTAAR